MGGKCNCAQVYNENRDVSFEELIKRGLICEACAATYRECCKLAEEE